MKKLIRQSLRRIILDRYLLILSLLLILLAIICSINLGFSINSSVIRQGGAQIISHHSDFGIQKNYTDQWIYLLSFIFFSITVSVLHISIAIKLLVARSRTFAIMFAWIGIGVILLGWITALSVVNIMIRG